MLPKTLWGFWFLVPALQKNQTNISLTNWSRGTKNRDPRKSWGGCDKSNQKIVLHHCVTSNFMHLVMEQWQHCKDFIRAFKHN